MSRLHWLPILALSACAYYPREDGERLHNEVYALQTQVTALQQALSELQTIEKAQAEQLGKMSLEVAELSKAARRNDADLGAQLDEMLQTVARMRGTVEAFDERVSNLEARSSKVQEELDVRFQGLADKQKIDTAQSDAEKQKAIEEARNRERLLATPTALFSEARKLITGGKAGEARKLLREFGIRIENDKSLATHQVEVQFLVGETYFVEQNYQQAAAEFNAIRKKNPKSSFYPEALFKLGLCFERLNLPEDAKLFYREVVDKHPKAAVAKEAKQRLKELK